MQTRNKLKTDPKQWWKKLKQWWKNQTSDERVKIAMKNIKTMIKESNNDERIKAVRGIMMK